MKKRTCSFLLLVALACTACGSNTKKVCRVIDGVQWVLATTEDTLSCDTSGSESDE